MLPPMGRLKTGRSTSLRRVPTDMDYKKAVELYYDVLPVLEKWAYEAGCHGKDEPRWTNVYKLLDEVGITYKTPD